MSVFEDLGAMQDPLRSLTQGSGALVVNDLSLLPLIRAQKWYQSAVSLDGIPLLSPYHLLQLHSTLPMHSLGQGELQLEGRSLGDVDAVGGVYHLESQWKPQNQFKLNLDMMRGQFAASRFWQSPKLKVSVWAEGQGVWYNSFLDGVSWTLRQSGDSDLAQKAPRYLQLAQMPSSRDLSLRTQLKWGSTEWRWGTLAGNEALYLANMKSSDPNDLAQAEGMQRLFDCFAKHQLHQSEIRHRSGPYEVKVQMAWQHSLSRTLLPEVTEQIVDSMDQSAEYYRMEMSQKTENHRWSLLGSWTGRTQFLERAPIDGNDYLLYRMGVLDIYTQLLAENISRRLIFESENPLIFDYGTAIEVSRKKKLSQNQVQWAIQDVWQLGNWGQISALLPWQWNHLDSKRLFQGLYPALQWNLNRGSLSVNVGSRWGSQVFWPLDLGAYGPSKTQAYQQNYAKFKWIGSVLSLDAGIWQRYSWREPWLMLGIMAENELQSQKTYLQKGLDNFLAQEHYQNYAQAYQDFVNGKLRGSAQEFVYWADLNELSSQLESQSLNYQWIGRQSAWGTDLGVHYQWKDWKGDFNAQLLWAYAWAPGYPRSIASQSIPWAYQWNQHFDLSPVRRISIKGSLRAGLPYTPSYVYQSNDELSPNEDLFVLGDKNSRRYSPYMRWDLRLSQKSTFWGIPVQSYVEIWNLLNTPNLFLRDSRTLQVQSYDLNMPIPFVFWGFEASF